MKAKKLIPVVLAVFIVSSLASSAFAILLIDPAFAAPRKVGLLSRLNLTPEEITTQVKTAIEDGSFNVFTTGEMYGAESVFYDSLMTLQMALTAGEVDEISLPEPVAEYVMNVNDRFVIVSIVRRPPAYLSFGFRKDDNRALRSDFNKALIAMKADGTLAVLRAKHINASDINEPEPVKFEVYDNAGANIKVAVTGDLPPIDFVAPDGKAAGFNTAVLAEIGKRLHANIELVNIDAGARAAALASGRADVVFWIESVQGLEKQVDVPEDIALSEPYYTWNEDFMLTFVK